MIYKIMTPDATCNLPLAADKEGEKRAMEYLIDTAALAEFTATAEPTATEAEMRRDLAEAMFQGAEIVSHSNGGVDVYTGPPPAGTGWRNFNPFTSAEDSRAMVAWLAADDARWLCFENCLMDMGFITRKSMMTAPLPVIARAAWLAIQGRRDE